MIKWLRRKWINRDVPSEDEQIEKLAKFLMEEVPQWPPVSGGAVDIAIEVIRMLQNDNSYLHDCLVQNE